MIQFWINSGAPYPGTYAALGSGMIGGYEQNQIDRSDLRWPSMKAAQQAMDRRCASCHKGPLKLPSSPTDNMGMPPWAVRYGDPRLRFSRHILYNLTRPEHSTLLLAPLAREHGGWATPPEKDQPAAKGVCPQVFADSNDPDYQVLLAAIRDTHKKLQEIKRFDMAGFIPRPGYLREMKRYGILPPGFDPAREGLDVYETDRKYWESFCYNPE
jgi:hypothetical protein